MNITSYETKKGEKRYKLKGYIGIDVLTGKQVNAQVTGKTEREVKLKYNRKLAEFEKNGFSSTKKTNSNTTFKEVAEEWFEIHRRKIKPSSIINTEWCLNKCIYPKLATYKIAKITPQILQRVMIEWCDNFSKSTYKKIINLVKQVIKYGVLTNAIPSNPFERTYIPQSTNKPKEKEFLTREELVLFLEAVNLEEDSYKRKKEYALFRLLAYSGCQIGEILALNWDDIDFDKKSIHINKTVSRKKVRTNVINIISDSPKNVASIGVVLLDPTTMKALKTWKTEQAKYNLAFGVRNDKKLLFTNLFNNVIDPVNINKRIVKILERTTIKKNISSHSFRHTHATLLLESGANIKDVQTRLRHADISTTLNTYTHQTDQNNQKNVERFMNYIQY
ncbi:Site-specific recombinase XerD [Pilibacter termitis]|uniref:Site-specific recombinase XerD n=1 Tax=Pilibacter termitis TaxID=263852 RepID=A0A1T4L6G0_9ENTE|nr:site-specific integrase [Pilibacter termitis]SJZ50150.1 Site-specific recombinase XerD [Pilibacter termitis]